MENQLSFAAVAAQRSEQASSPTVEQPEAVDQPEAVETQEAVVDAQEQVEATENTEQVVPSQEEPITFEKLLEERGFDLSNVDREDLYKSAVNRIVSAAEMQAQLEAARRELESLRSAQAQQSSTAPAQTQEPVVQQPGESPEQAAQRAFRQLRPYDPQLRELVTEDERTGKFVPRPEFGQAALEAARTINEYVRLEQEQAQAILRDPHRIVDDRMPDIEKRIMELAQKLVDERLGSFQSETAKREQEWAAQRAQQEQEARWNQWHETNKSKIFRLGSDGQPLKKTFEEGYATTPVGTYFMEKLAALRQDFPDADPIKLHSTALEMAEMAVRPSMEMTQTPAQKRAALVQQHASVPHQEVIPATSEELGNNPPSRTLKFAEMVRTNPETAPIVSSWRK